MFPNNPRLNKQSVTLLMIIMKVAFFSNMDVACSMYYVNYIVRGFAMGPYSDFASLLWLILASLDSTEISSFDFVIFSSKRS